jgi:hypothetical protein
VYDRNIEPTTHTQPSIVRIDDEDDDDESSSSESEDAILIKSEIPPSPIETSDSVNNLLVVENISLIIFIHSFYLCKI